MVIFARLQHHQMLTAIGLNYFTFTLQHEESPLKRFFLSIIVNMERSNSTV
jgi:hypothetical protein